MTSNFTVSIMTTKMKHATWPFNQIFSLDNKLSDWGYLGIKNQQGIDNSAFEIIPTI